MKSTLPPLATKKTAKTRIAKPRVTVRASTNLTVPATIGKAKPVPGKIKQFLNRATSKVVKSPTVAKGKVTKIVVKGRATNVENLKKRIAVLKAQQKSLEESNTEATRTLAGLKDQITNSNARLMATNLEVSAAQIELSRLVNETARNMIVYDDFREKVRIAKVAAMNVHGTLLVVQRDLKAVIDEPSPNSSTTDVMEALMNGELSTSPDSLRATGEVARMVDGLVGNEDADFPRIKTVAGAEGSDLGLIPEDAETFTPDGEGDYAISVETDLSPISDMFAEETPSVTKVTDEVLEEHDVNESIPGTFQAGLAEAEEAVTALANELEKEQNDPALSGRDNERLKSQHVDSQDGVGAFVDNIVLEAATDTRLKGTNAR